MAGLSHGIIAPVSETKSLATKVVFFIDEPSGIRNKESTRGLEKLEGLPFNGGEADFYTYWGLEGWDEADLSGTSALDFCCLAPLSESLASILRILDESHDAKVAVMLNCECSSDQLAVLRNRGCAIMPARTIRRHVSRIMKEQLISDWMAGRPPRSGSMALADFLSLSVPARFPVFHEHTWAAVAADGGMVWKESKPGGGNPVHMRRRMTEAFLAEPAPYRFVFSLHRNPIQRLHSYFAKRSKERFKTPNFDVDSVRQEFEFWVRKQVNSYLRWLDVDWPDMIGFRQSEMNVIAPGIRHRQDARQSVTVIETSKLGTITQDLLEQYGRERYPALKRNSLQELDIADHYEEFVESCPIPESVAERLMAHPEVQALGCTGDGLR